MIRRLEDCDLNNDYFHFTNKRNANSILEQGLLPSKGAASALIDDRPNVSISQGGKGIIGIINSFLYKFSTELKISEIPEEYREYFSDIEDFNSNSSIPRNSAFNAMLNKLKDEVYFRVQVSPSQLQEAKIGGLTGYDINLPNAIESSQLDLIVGDDMKALSAYDVAKDLYTRTQDKEIFRQMHTDFYDMFDMEQSLELETSKSAQAHTPLSKPSTDDMER